MRAQLKHWCRGGMLQMGRFRGLIDQMAKGSK